MDSVSGHNMERFRAFVRDIGFEKTVPSFSYSWERKTPFSWREKTVYLLNDRRPHTKIAVTQPFTSKNVRLTH